MRFKKILPALLLALFGLFQEAFATHIVGSTIHYKYIGGDSYEIKVTLYRDCRTTNPPIPVAAPPSVAINVRRSDNTTMKLFSSSRTKTLLTLPLPDDPCVKEPDVKVCVEQYDYIITSDKFPAGFDYYVYFSLCCRNTTITNLDPLQQTETIYTKIPDRNVFPNLTSAQFVTQPPSYVCGGKPFTIKNLAVDSGDGDKLVYELYTPNAGNKNDIQSDSYIPQISGGFPVFTPVTYSTVKNNGNNVTFSGQSPMAANEVITPDSGKLTINANIYGQFVVGVKVKEFRGNQLISETMRDYQYNVVKCPPEDVAKLALTDICKSLKGTFANQAVTDPTTPYLWEFNDAGNAPNDNSTSITPTYTFSKAGNYKIKLTVNPNTICARSDSATIKVSQMKAAFTTTPDTCAGIPVDFVDKSTSSVNTPINQWNWSFGDGATSTTQSPTRPYPNGGNFNVRLIVTNSIGCKDSVVNVIKVIQVYPDAIAGTNDTLCKNNSTATLKGVVQNAGGGLWKGGNGTFNPDRKTLTAKYTPTTTELATGIVNLTLLTTQNGQCGADSSQTALVYTVPPVVNPALAPYSPICANNLQMDLFGGISPTNKGYGIIWSGGGGQFTSDLIPAKPETDLFARYIPSVAERAAGKVTLTITSTNNGECVPVSASTTVNISPAPIVSAGNDTTVCANNADVSLNGTLSTPTSVTWSSDGGDGTFVGGSTSLKTTYRPGPSDISNGQVRIFLSTPKASAGAYPANCDAVVDTMIITINPAPVVDAGVAQTVCANNPKVTLKGKLTPFFGTGTGKWSGGGGTFAPDVNALTMTYTPSAAELATQSATLYLTSTNNGKCLAVKDSVKIVVTPAPLVTVGLPQGVCKNNPSIKLNGSVTGGATTGAWSGGNGSYSPDSTNLKATYTPTPNEISAGSITLTLKATNLGKCLVESKDITYTFNDLPKIDAGSSLLVCKNVGDAFLNATVIQGATSVRWSGGNGTFSPSDSVIDAIYTATQAELSAGETDFDGYKYW
jgi:PKD repeat protein